MLASLAERLRPPSWNSADSSSVPPLTAAQPVSDKLVCMLLLKTRSAGNLACKDPGVQRLEERHLEPLCRCRSGGAFSSRMACLPAGVEFQALEM